MDQVPFLMSQKQTATGPKFISMMTPNSSCKPQWAHLEYCWCIENFWELRALASIEALGEEGGDLVWSKPFGDKRRGIWRLKLYPYGDSSEGGKGHVSLFLSLQTSAMDVPKAYAIFGCYVLDATGNKISGSGRSFTRQKFTDTSASWGWSQFIKVEEQVLTKMLVKDTLTLKCDIDVFVGIKTTPFCDLGSTKNFKDEILTFLQSPASHDTTVTLGDGVVTVNSVLLSARSEVFKKMLRSVPESSHPHRAALMPFEDKAVGTDTATTAPGTPDGGLARIPDDTASSASSVGSKYSLVLDDVTVSAFNHIVTYLLQDECSVLTTGPSSLTELLEVYRAAHVYGVTSLETACVGELLGRIICKENAWLIRAVARETKNELLLSECHAFLEQAAETLQGSELMEMLLPKTKTAIR